MLLLAFLISTPKRAGLVFVDVKPVAGFFFSPKFNSTVEKIKTGGRARDKRKEKMVTAREKNFEKTERHRKGEGKQNSLLSCNQSLFGGSVTGSWSNVVRIERAEEGEQVGRERGGGGLGVRFVMVDR